MSSALVLGLLIPAGLGSLILICFCWMKGNIGSFKDDVAMHGETPQHENSYYVYAHMIILSVVCIVGLPTLGLAIAALAIGGFESSPNSEALSYGGLVVIVLPLAAYCIASALHRARRWKAVNTLRAGADASFQQEARDAESQARAEGWYEKARFNAPGVPTVDLASWMAFQLTCSACGRLLVACYVDGEISSDKINVQIGGERVECETCLDPSTIGQTYLSSTVLRECRKREAKAATAAAPEAIKLQVEEPDLETGSSPKGDPESGLATFQGHSAADAEAKAQAEARAKEGQGAEGPAPAIE